MNDVVNAANTLHTAQCMPSALERRHQATNLQAQQGTVGIYDCCKPSGWQPLQADTLTCQQLCWHKPQSPKTQRIAGHLPNTAAIPLLLHNTTNATQLYTAGTHPCCHIHLVHHTTVAGHAQVLPAPLSAAPAPQQQGNRGHVRTCLSACSFQFSHAASAAAAAQTQLTDRL